MNVSPGHVSRRTADLDDWLEWLETLHPKKIDFSLGRITEVLRIMNLARPPYRVMTIGGTNGKGSCVAILESIYLAAGYSVGALTSPHLWRFNERIRVDGKEAPDDELVDIFRVIDSARGEITLSYFEYSVVAALARFERKRVDVALLEVGLGGRLDAVNAVDPDVSLIASIDLDHREWLGETRDEIAVEKAGILRPGRPAIVADRTPPGSLLDHARGLGANLSVLGRDFDFAVSSDGELRPTGIVDVPKRLPGPSFGGAVQDGNVVACVAAVRSLSALLPVPNDAIAAGIARARITGRLERFELDGVEWVFDVAHNPAAARALGGELEARCVPGRTLVVFAAMTDKDLDGITEPLLPLVDEWIVTTVRDERSASVKQLRTQLEAQGVGRVATRSTVAEACRMVTSLAAAGDRIVVYGSCYLIGPAMTALGLYSAASQPDD